MKRLMPGGDIVWINYRGGEGGGTILKEGGHELSESESGT